MFKREARVSFLYASGLSIGLENAMNNGAIFSFRLC